MTDHDEAVQIVATAIFVHPELPQNQADAAAAVAALRARWEFVEPGELAALHEKLRGALDSVGRLTEELDAARAEIKRLRGDNARLHEAYMSLDSRA